MAYLILEEAAGMSFKIIQVHRKIMNDWNKLYNIVWPRTWAEGEKRNLK